MKFSALLPLQALLCSQALAIVLPDAIPQSPILSYSSSLSLLELHKGLVEIESITNNEHSVGQYLAKYLKSQNFTVETQDVGPAGDKPRQNILAYIGSQNKTRVLVTSHIDVVPPYHPYKRIGDEIWGRGSVDAKASVATQIKAVEELLSEGKISEGDVALLYVVGEEVGGDGMIKANDLGLEWEAAIFGEPTELKLASGHKGVMGAEVRAKGIAGHSGTPELGKSANEMLVKALYALLHTELPSSEKYGNTTLNIGVIQGGVAANVIPEDASAKLSVRVAAGETNAVARIISQALDTTGEEFNTTFRYGYGPVDLDHDVPGFDTSTENYGTDIPNLKGGHKRYLYGPGSILVAHSDHEHLSISELHDAVRGYKALIQHSLK